MFSSFCTLCIGICIAVYNLYKRLRVCVDNRVQSNGIQCKKGCIWMYTYVMCMLSIKSICTKMNIQFYNHHSLLVFMLYLVLDAYIITWHTHFDIPFMMHHVCSSFTLLCSWLSAMRNNDISLQTWNLMVESSAHFMHLFTILLAFGFTHRNVYMLYIYKLCICVFALYHGIVFHSVYEFTRELWTNGEAIIHIHNRDYLNMDILCIMIFGGWVCSVFWSRVVWFI